MSRGVAPFGLAAVLYSVLTVALTWPLILAPATTVPNDLGDPLLNTSLIAWNARTLPLTARWWNVPQFYPQPGVTAFSEHLLGLSPLTTPIVKLTGNPLLAYNAAFLLSFVLCGLSAHLLAYVLTRRHDIGVLAGLAFAFAPYRMSQIAHLQVLSAYWMPLALDGAALVLRRSPSAVVDSFRRVVADAGSGLRLLPVLSVDLDRALAHLVRRRPRAVVAYRARDRDVGRRGAGHGADRVRLPEVPACVWLAPLAG